MTDHPLPAPPKFYGRRPICSCGHVAILLRGDELYRRGKLAEKQFWVCRPCDAAIGCHPGTIRPLGTLATQEVRGWRRSVHAAFDPLWQSEGVDRSEAYRELAQLLGLPPELCHIGLFDVEWCRRALMAVTWMRPAAREAA